MLHKITEHAEITKFYMSNKSGENQIFRTNIGIF